MIWILISEVFWSFTAIFVACECAERLNVAFAEISDKIDTIDWYKYPIGMWRMFLILIVAAQQPSSLCVIGSISCDRQTFKKVCCI